NTVTEQSRKGLPLSDTFKARSDDYFFWYRQYPGKPPEFLISHSGTGVEISDPVPGITFKVSDNKTLMTLQISSAAVTDSAVYYCAVRPTLVRKVSLHSYVCFSRCLADCLFFTSLSLSHALKLNTEIIAFCLPSSSRSASTLRTSNAPSPNLCFTYFTLSKPPSRLHHYQCLFLGSSNFFMVCRCLTSE
uniref:Immunoglobulin V-set domain-containing protein n=1 Tax=Oreochromis niloticus TaxID=8128 RepID=A0A669CPR3_ORENI